jgi:hypothetical protein
MAKNEVAFKVVFMAQADLLNSRPTINSILVHSGSGNSDPKESMDTGLKPSLTADFQQGVAILDPLAGPWPARVGCL